eukprot:scaffold86437_cov62-Phaeocystis_antarctica.AAC.10
MQPVGGGRCVGGRLAAAVRQRSPVFGGSVVGLGRSAGIGRGPKFEEPRVGRDSLEEPRVGRSLCEVGRRGAARLCAHSSGAISSAISRELELLDHQAELPCDLRLHLRLEAKDARLGLLEL